MGDNGDRGPGAGRLPPERGEAGAPAPDPLDANQRGSDGQFSQAQLRKRKVVFGIDWLTISGRLEIGRLGEIVEDEYRAVTGPGEGVFWIHTAKKWRWWRDCREGPLGSRLYGDHVEAPGWVGVELPGVICQAIGMRGLRRILEGVRDASSEWRVTRIDLAWDHVEFSGEDMIAAHELGAVTSRAEWMMFGTPPTRTYYLGRKGAQQLTVYFKREGEFNRLELRIWGRDVCTPIARGFMAWSGVEFGRRAKGLIAAFTDVDRSWWRAFMASAIEGQLERSPTAPADAARIREFMSRTVAKSAAKYVALEGWEGMRRIVADGAKRISATEWLELGVELTPELMSELGRVGPGYRGS